MEPVEPVVTGSCNDKGKLHAQLRTNMDTNPHHLQRTQDLYQAMDDMAAFSEKQHMTNPVPTKKQYSLKLHFERAAFALAYLNETGARSTLEVASVLGMSRESTKEVLRRMRDRDEVIQLGKVNRGRGSGVMIWQAARETLNRQRRDKAVPAVVREPSDIWRTPPTGDFVKLALKSRMAIEMAWGAVVAVEHREAA